VIRAVATLFALIFLLLIVPHVPILTELKLRIGTLPMTGADITKDVISLVVIGILLHFAYSAENQLPKISTRFSQSGLLTASVIHIIVIFIAYYAFRDLAQNLQNDIWVFYVILLLLLCYPLYRGGRAYYKGANEVADLLTAKIGSETDEFVKCPTCGEENDPSAKFCKACGTKFVPPVPPKSIICPHCGTENELSAKFCYDCGKELVAPAVSKGVTCPQCGTENQAGAKYCSDCGTALSDHT
jgi:DNA-directed RNA polymerase subunit RPC12/RpoP